MDQFNVLRQLYGDFIASDPMRQMHYRAVIAKLAQEKVATRSRILDIGCGEGALDRVLSSPPHNFSMTGIDTAKQFIDIAKNEEVKNRKGITYYNEPAMQFHNDFEFDAAVSVMVMPYAKTPGGLREFFSCAYRNLLPGTSFSSVVLNPQFSKFDATIGNRIFGKLPEDQVQVHFLHPETKDKVFGAKLTQFSKDVYESKAKQAGFFSLEWNAVLPTTEQQASHDAEFWRPVIAEQPYSLLTVKRK